MLSLSFLQKFSEFLRLNSQKCCEPVSSLHFWLPNVPRATPRALFRLIPCQCPPHSPLYRAYLSNIPSHDTMEKILFRDYLFASTAYRLLYSSFRCCMLLLHLSVTRKFVQAAGTQGSNKIETCEIMILWFCGSCADGTSKVRKALCTDWSWLVQRWALEKFRSCQLPNVLVLCFPPPVGFSWLVPTRIASWLGSTQKNPHQKCWARTATGWALPIILSYQYDALHILCKWCMCMCRITLQTSLLLRISMEYMSLSAQKPFWDILGDTRDSWQITFFFELNIEPKWAKSRNPIRLFQRLTCLACSGNDLSQQNSISVGGSSCDINMSWLARCSKAARA